MRHSVTKQWLTLSADLVGVADEASPAAACRSVAVHLAHSIHAACQRRARVLALFLDAGKVIRAFWISRAFGSRGCGVVGKQISTFNR